MIARADGLASGARVEAAAALMARFAKRTGLVSGSAPDSAAGARRYLWTDAFAVCCFLGLASATGEPRYADLAFGLIDRVHHTLGRHRPDARRRGWISGLDELEGERHPTRGGLRIGKQLPERAPGDLYDESLEWDRDGQYFHYLTKWMHALDQASRFAGRPELNVWARELGQAAHSAFCHGTPGRARRMHWKMSVDLSRPLVASMGQHDPLDGLVTSLELSATGSALGAPSAPDLARATADYAAMLPAQTLATTDPLGIGGLLADAYRLEQLGPGHARPYGALADALLGAAVDGLDMAGGFTDVREPASRRLAFRELGLAIGLHAVTLLRDSARPAQSPAGPARKARLDALGRYEWLVAEIEGFWLGPRQQGASSWAEHEDINEVMLATSLLPSGFLRLHSPPRR
jgi:hypothetical protein